jgi:hypothetical protein
MAFAALAILGQRSAHSLPMGPVIAEPAKKQFVNWNGHMTIQERSSFYYTKNGHDNPGKV